MSTTDFGIKRIDSFELADLKNNNGYQQKMLSQNRIKIFAKIGFLKS